MWEYVRGLVFTKLLWNNTLGETDCWRLTSWRFYSLRHMGHPMWAKVAVKIDNNAYTHVRAAMKSWENSWDRTYCSRLACGHKQCRKMLMFVLIVEIVEKCSSPNKHTVIPCTNYIEQLARSSLKPVAMSTKTTKYARSNIYDNCVP